jgi:hypothetical protein
MEFKDHLTAGDKPMQLDNGVNAWKSGLSYHLVSLLDMLNFCAKEFIDLMSEIEELIDALYADDPHFSVLGENWGKIGELLMDASNWCELLELSASQELINQITLRRDKWSVKSLNEAKENIKILRDIIKRELSKRLFMFVPQEQAKWYQKEKGFGDKVYDAFPSAKGDIKEAGNCYATGRYTASVFHLMRVLEHGLRALAKDVELSFDVEQWYDIINKTEKEIKKDQQRLPKSVEKNERLKFLSEAAKEFTYFKDGWRNYVSHNRSNYDGPQALSAFNHVRSFMTHLATELKE